MEVGKLQCGMRKDNCCVDYALVVRQLCGNIEEP